MSTTSPSHYNQLKEALCRSSKENLHLIFDFDRTLTIGKDGTSLASSSFSVFRELGILGEEYTRTSAALFNTYHPIEISQTASSEEKDSAMNEWWEKHLELLMAHKLSKQDFKNVATNGNLHLRRHVKEVFEVCHEKNIPIVILSAGLGDVVTSVLENEKVNYPNIKIVSNWFLFEGDDVTGYKTPFIHAANKDENHISQQIKESLAGRDNILLAGDSLGDLKMLPHGAQGKIIKFGFLNGNRDLLEEFCKNFDYVEERVDADFSEVLKIVREI